MRALVHREDERSASLAAAGAEIVVGDMLDLAAVTAATRDITAAYFTYPISARFRARGIEAVCTQQHQAPRAEVCIPANSYTQSGVFDHPAGEGARSADDGSG